MEEEKGRKTYVSGGEGLFVTILLLRPYSVLVFFFCMRTLHHKAGIWADRELPTGGPPRRKKVGGGEKREMDARGGVKKLITISGFKF